MKKKNIYMIENEALMLFTVPEATPLLQSLVTGLFHAFLFSLPINPTLILALRVISLRGIKEGIVAYISVSLGTTVFNLCILCGLYTAVEAWYLLEPFLFLFGCIKSFQMLVDPTQIEPVSLFFLQFCNPVYLIQVSRSTIVSFEMNYILGSSKIVYMCSFFVGMFSFSICFGIIIKKFVMDTQVSRTFGYKSASLQNVSAIQSDSQKELFFDRVFAVFAIALIIKGASKYTWRLFIKYPFDLFGAMTGIQEVQRELPTGDSGIRRRYFGKKLGRPRRVPRDRFERSLNILREQRAKKSIYKSKYFNERLKVMRKESLKRHQRHFVNRFAKRVLQARIFLRTPSEYVRSPEEISYLHRKGPLAMRSYWQPYDKDDGLETFALQSAYDNYLKQYNHQNADEYLGDNEGGHSEENGSEAGHPDYGQGANSKPDSGQGANGKPDSGQDANDTQNGIQIATRIRYQYLRLLESIKFEEEIIYEQNEGDLIHFDQSDQEDQGRDEGSQENQGGDQGSQEGQTNEQIQQADQDSQQFEVENQNSQQYSLREGIKNYYYEPLFGLNQFARFEEDIIYGQEGDEPGEFNPYRNTEGVRTPTNKDNFVRRTINKNKTKRKSRFGYITFYPSHRDPIGDDIDEDETFYLNVNEVVDEGTDSVGY